MVDGEELRRLVMEISEAGYARYPSLSRTAVTEAVADFLAGEA